MSHNTLEGISIMKSYIMVHYLTLRAVLVCLDEYLAPGRPTNIFYLLAPRLSISTRAGTSRDC